jgi:hypothetical protein
MFDDWKGKKSRLPFSVLKSNGLHFFQKLVNSQADKRASGHKRYYQMKRGDYLRLNSIAECLTELFLRFCKGISSDDVKTDMFNAPQPIISVSLIFAFNLAHESKLDENEK